MRSGLSIRRIKKASCGGQKGGLSPSLSVQLHDLRRPPKKANSPRLSPRGYLAERAEPARYPSQLRRDYEPSRSRSAASCTARAEAGSRCRQLAEGSHPPSPFSSTTCAVPLKKQNPQGFRLGGIWRREPSQLGIRASSASEQARHPSKLRRDSEPSRSRSAASCTERAEAGADAGNLRRALTLPLRSAPRPAPSPEKAKSPRLSPRGYLAEREGFEPSLGY